MDEINKSSINTLQGAKDYTDNLILSTLDLTGTIVKPKLFPDDDLNKILDPGYYVFETEGFCIENSGRINALINKPTIAQGWEVLVKNTNNPEGQQWQIASPVVAALKVSLVSNELFYMHDTELGDMFVPALRKQELTIQYNNDDRCTTVVWERIQNQQQDISTFGNWQIIKRFNNPDPDKPHTWPEEDVEVNFGDGTFGKRLAGPQHPGTNIVFTSGAQTLKIIDCGGWWGCPGASKLFIGHAYGAPTISFSSWFKLLQMNMTEFGIVVEFFNTAGNWNYPYDIWVRYTK